MPMSMPVIQFVHDPPAAQALAQGLVTKLDLLKLKAIAKLHARGLPASVTWSDLLQEAFTRVLEGRRRQPEGVPMVAFIAEVMRSLRSDHLRHARADALQARRMQAVQPPMVDALAQQMEAEQQLENILALFADDAQSLQLIAGLAAGLTPAEICQRHGFSATDYDSTRRRIRRALLREGLRSTPP